MEGEKERQRQQREEKESNEAEEDRRSDDDADNEEEEDEDSEGAALVWQEGYSEDNLGLPIMHWEALSLRIAELEKQEEEKKGKKAKVRGHSLGERSMMFSPGLGKVGFVVSVIEPVQEKVHHSLVGFRVQESVTERTLSLLTLS